MAKLTKITYIPNTQVPSANLNALQDEAINMPVRVAAAHGYQSAGGAGSTFDGTGTYTINSAAQTLTVPLVMKPGTRLTALRARVTDQPGFGTGTCQLRLIKATDGVNAVIASSAVSDTTGLQTLSITGQTEDISEVGVNIGDVYLAEVIFAGAVPQSVHSVEWDTDVIP